MLAPLPSILEKMLITPKRMINMKLDIVPVLELPPESTEVKISSGVSLMEYFTLLSLIGKLLKKIGKVRITMEKDGKKVMKSQLLNCHQMSLSTMHSCTAQILQMQHKSQHALI